MALKFDLSGSHLTFWAVYRYVSSSIMSYWRNEFRRNHTEFTKRNSVKQRRPQREYDVANLSARWRSMTTVFCQMKTIESRAQGFDFHIHQIPPHKFRSISAISDIIMREAPVRRPKCCVRPQRSKSSDIAG